MSDKTEILRVCNPNQFGELLSSDAGANRFSGLFSILVNRYVDMVVSKFNMTPKFDGKYPGIGHRIGNNDSYDGCIGQLQRGEADLMVTGMDYPVDVTNVTQGLLMVEEKTAFVGVFPRPEANRTADFLRSVYAFDFSVYLMIFSFLIMCTVLLEMRNRMIVYFLRPIIKVYKKGSTTRSSGHLLQLRIIFRRKKLDKIGFLNVLRHYCCSYFIEADSSFVAVTTLVLSIFSFIIFAHFNSLLNTDLVVPSKVIMYTSYDDIMEANKMPFFINYTSYYTDLKYAKEGSKGKLFWNWAVDKFGEKNILLGLNSDSYSKFIDIAKGEVILFSGEKWIEGAKILFCELLGRSIDRMISLAKAGTFLDKMFSSDFDFYTLSEAQIYIRSDESAIKKIKGLVFGKRILESEVLYSKLKTIFRGILEHGFFVEIISTSNVQKMSDIIIDYTQITGKPLPERREIKQICLEYNSPFPKTPRFDHFMPSHLKYTSITCSVLLAVAFVRFLYEIWN